MSNYSGNEDHEVKDNNNDLRSEKISMVDVCTTVDSKEALTQEDIKIKAQELKERAKKRREEEEKKLEKEREKERIRVGKEMMEAKRMEEDNERKRVLALRKAEKDEEKRAREKIRQKLEEDKAERRLKLGLNPEIPSSQKMFGVDAESSHYLKSLLPIRPATKLEQMRECLRSLKINNKDDEIGVKKAFQTLFTYVGNIFKRPDEEKFRKIRPTNTVFLERVGRFKEGIEFLELCGFERVEEEGDDLLFMSRDKVDSTLLTSAGVELKSAIENPFFGLL